MENIFSTRLKEIMKSHDYKQIDIIEKSKIYSEVDVKLTKTFISDCVNGKIVPRQEKLSLLAKTLNVSEGWLLGYSVPKDRNNSNNMINKIKLNVQGLSNSELEQVNSFIEYLKFKRKMPN
ncbi:transcriptional regulator [Staphylococcus gallinarum]|uniref:transcriptional regulator n=1 Tax=Staphylococcus gallinarum TaxID=1293 RepID=UPI0031795AF6